MYGPNLGSMRKVPEAKCASAKAKGKNTGKEKAGRQEKGRAKAKGSAREETLASVAE